MVNIPDGTAQCAEFGSGVKTSCTSDLQCGGDTPKCGFSNGERYCYSPGSCPAPLAQRTVCTQKEVAVCINTQNDPDYSTHCPACVINISDGTAQCAAFASGENNECTSDLQCRADKPKCGTYNGNKYCYSPGSCPAASVFTSTSSTQSSTTTTTLSTSRTTSVPASTTSAICKNGASKGQICRPRQETIPVDQPFYSCQGECEDRSNNGQGCTSFSTLTDGSCLLDIACCYVQEIPPEISTQSSITTITQSSTSTLAPSTPLPTCKNGDSTGKTCRPRQETLPAASKEYSCQGECELRSNNGQGCTSFTTLQDGSCSLTIACCYQQEGSQSSTTTNSALQQAPTPGPGTAQTCRGLGPSFQSRLQNTGVIFERYLLQDTGVNYPEQCLNYCVQSKVGIVEFLYIESKTCSCIRGGSDLSFSASGGVEAGNFYRITCPTVSTSYSMSSSSSTTLSTITITTTTTTTTTMTSASPATSTFGISFDSSTCQKAGIRGVDKVDLSYTRYDTFNGISDPQTCALFCQNTGSGVITIAPTTDGTKCICQARGLTLEDIITPDLSSDRYYYDVSCLT